MTINRSGLFWGLLLIGAGAVALGQQMGYIDQFSDPQFWIWTFAFVSAIAIIEYALSGFKQWGWLFPAGVFGGLAVTILLATNDVNSAAVGSPLFIGLLIPFAAAYLLDRARNWWALIPGGVMLFLTLVTLLVDSAGGEWIGALFLFMIAGAFLAVYLNNRARIWALIVAYVTVVIGLAPVMAFGGGSTPAYYGSVFLAGVALPFFVLYFRSSQNWWAIIPAGTLLLLAIIAAAAIAGLINDDGPGAFVSAGYVNAFFMGGLAATFAVVWLRHEKPWAKVVTLALAAVAVASLFFGSYSQIFWPVAFILVGVYLFYTALRPKTV